MSNGIPVPPRVIFTQFLQPTRESLRVSYARIPKVAAFPNGRFIMDLFYLLLLVLLIGATAAFLRMCARLEDRK
jgi:hypothetical protein